MIPARLVVKRYERQKYACAHGRAMKVAPLPRDVVAEGRACFPATSPQRREL